MKLSKKNFQQPARFELLPLLDVIFLLLIFFVFVMLKMTMQSSINIELPQLVDSQQQTEELLVISINSKNQLFINEEVTTEELMLAQVINLQKDNKLPILIRGDKKSDLGVALSILDKLRLSGFHHVAFATDKDQ
ncbi:outer membrane transport energization protein ExbD [Psychromonas ingrahamii 37]|uniref:Outer membrane transport energization protein ExbD n=1 Tax=Psychromonas ingrahamii (strain DSM 17664 / CCUG 51855 / 37) TaxID=357804 RepID=A1SZW7_PSYIN|nr:biopolymer transporter ExbD [Psychromonas ingrahamii]ABM05032.1 outer membrane transport energization protein ExbD [Psychromonas ingrahamii 37]